MSKPTCNWFYHVSFPHLRRHIEQDGLLWASECDDLDEQGVYVFDNPRDARRFGKAQFPDGTPYFKDGYDIWGLMIATEDAQYLEEDPLEWGGWMYPTENALEPMVLRLLSVPRGART